MKRLLFVLVLLVSQVAAGQTVDDLFAKYKGRDAAMYMTIPPDSLMQQAAFKGSKVRFAESLSLVEADAEMLRKDLEALQGYEQIDLMEHAVIENEMQRKFLDYWIRAGLAAYARRRGRNWSEALDVIPLPNGCWTLMHVKGRLKERAFQVLVSVQAETVRGDGGQADTDHPEGSPAE